MNDYQTLVEHIYHHNFFVFDNLLSYQVVLSLRNLAKKLLKDDCFKPAKVGHGADTSVHQNIRLDSIYWLDDTCQHLGVNAFFNEITAITNLLNQQLFLGLIESECHLAQYQPGAYYKKHTDQFKHQKNRRISFSYYLNLHWETSFGGQLCLYQKNNEPLATIMPVANRLVCFASDLPHEVCVTIKPRLSLTGWLKTR